jgi:hypothetical protein
VTRRTTPEELEALFVSVEAAQAAAYGSSRRRLLPDHPLDVFAEVRFPGREWALVVTSDEQLGDRELVLANGLTCRVNDGSVEVVAQPATDREIFCALLVDLVQHLETTAVGPAAALTRRISSWQRMLSRGLEGGLSAEARLGLFGELLILRDLVVPVCGDNSVASWTGPRGGAKDFTWASWALEAKTTSNNRGSVRCRIHGEEQLEAGALEFVALVHQTLRPHPQGVSLPDLVDELRSHPELASQTTELENNLLESGWLDAHRGQYEGERWTLATRRCFRVGDGFPRITTDMLPAGVSGVSYTLDLQACVPFRVDESQLRVVLGSQTQELPEGRLVRE